MESWNSHRLSVYYPASPGFRFNFISEYDEKDKVQRVMPRRKDNGETRDYLAWLLDRLHDVAQVNIFGIANLTREIDGLMQNNPKEKARISLCLGGLLSDRSLVAELYHQFERYRPPIFLAERCSKVLMHREQDVVASPWAKAIGIPMRQIEDTLTKNVSSEYLRNQLGRAGDPTTGSFRHPSTKRRTKENVEAMQNAERHLDNLWAQVDTLLAQELDKDVHQIYVALTPDLMHIERTKDWQEPALKPTKRETSLPVRDIKALDEERRQQTERTTSDARSLALIEKPKIKTRGTPRPDELIPRNDENNQDPAQQNVPIAPLFTLNRRAFKALSKLFHDNDSTNQQGELLWNDFLYAMGKVGFGIEKLYGSVWLFSPTSPAITRSIQFHEPHPSVKVPPNMARTMGRRLNRAYGWTSSNFAQLE
jgi:hypothetical protein